MADLFAKKPLARLMEEAQEVGEHSLKRSLGPVNLVALGIGGVIGAGLFVRTAAAIAADAWSEYANRVLSWFHMAIPYQWTHSPFEHDPGGTYGIMNVPALFILLILTMLLIKGTKESAFVNGLIVILKVSIVLLFIGIGWQFINPA